MRLRVVIPALILMTSLAPRSGAQSKPVPPLADLDPLLAKAATYEHGQSREALVSLAEFVTASLASPAQVTAIEKKLSAFLLSGATPGGKDGVARQLSLIATAASVPDMTRLLATPETAALALYVLDRIPGPAADEALRKQLPAAGGKLRVGLLNAVGRRRDAKAVPLLRSEAAGKDAEAAAAALGALAAIGDPAAAKALLAVRPKLSGALKEEAAHATLRCADRLAAAGQPALAATLFESLAGASEPAVIRVGSLAGLARTRKAGSLKLLAGALSGADEPVAGEAVALLRDTPGPEAAKALLAALPKLEPARQERVVYALADRDEKAAQPAIAPFLKAESPRLRRAAIVALGRIGDGAAVMPLAEAAASSDAQDAAAAREGLNGLRGADIDKAVLAAIASGAGGAKLALIRACGERGMAAATPALIALVSDAAPEIRQAAYRSLRDTAPADAIPQLVTLVTAAPNASDRREAERALSAALARHPSAPIAPVAEAYRGTQSGTVQASLLQVMGQSGRKDALPILREGLAQQSSELKRAAILALTEWPTPEPIADLMSVARSDASASAQVLSLRGVLRLLALPMPPPRPEVLRILKEVAGLARQPEEKRALLSLLVRNPGPEALALAESLAQDPSVASEAKMAIERLKRGGRP